ncbi:hypothetical protein [Sediminicoccus rosea]|jgi:hypothetical protein|uniref:Uncharacterized protein n=1 Tax=Sediminicoccus rosea TaxID=1225128 RepID=A0ABZ0PJH7_9PROT|nr:hypothetical protein [Sediminicoccus rosea]WPB85879.1 hypothetical protein R9Z33_03160 [Sediminicoccus rosea]
MVKASLVIMAVLTVLVAMGLRWREQRLPLGKPQPRQGWIAAQKAKANRWVTAAAIAAIGTTVILGGLHWLRVLQG